MHIGWKMTQLLTLFGPFLHALFNALLAMVKSFPRTLEALILHMLTPVGAEVLTRKFEEMDELNTKEDGNRFFEVFYESFSDQFAAMDAILNGKELFALQAYKNVLDKNIGVDWSGPKPSLMKCRIDTVLKEIGPLGYLEGANRCIFIAETFFSSLNS